MNKFGIVVVVMAMVSLITTLACAQENMVCVKGKSVVTSNSDGTTTIRTPKICTVSK